MIHVKQTQEYIDGETRGNCFPACVASIFEVPLEVLPWQEMARYGDSALQHWLEVHYPGVGTRSRDCEPFDADEDEAQLGRFVPHGLWIATVESPRFTEPCTIHTAEGGEAMPPFWYDAADCPHCGGTGTRPGFHAVVARGGAVVHDPSPRVSGYGWSYNGRLCQATWFEVWDPARLVPRRLP